MASPMCSTSQKSLLPPSVSSNQLQSEPSHCCACNKPCCTNIYKNANSDQRNDEQPSESLLATLIECVSDNKVNCNIQVNNTSLNFCNQCATLLGNWRIFHNEEIKVHGKTENLKAQLTARILESQFSHSKRNGNNGGDFSHLDQLRTFVHQKYKCKVHVQLTPMEELRKISIASKTNSSRRQSIPPCNFQEGVLICKQCPQRFAGSRAILALRDHFQEKHEGTQSGSPSDDLVAKISSKSSPIKSPVKTKVGRADAAVQVDIEDFIGYLKKEEPKHDDDDDDSESPDLKPDVAAPESVLDTKVNAPENDVATTKCIDQLPEVSKKSSSDTLGTVNSNPQDIWLDEVAPGKYNYGGYPVTFIDGKYWCCACWKDFTLKANAFKHIEFTHMGLQIHNVHVQNVGTDKYMYRRQVPFFRKDGTFSCGLCSFHEEQKHSAQPSKTFFTHLSSEHLKNISMDPEERLVQCSHGEFRYSFLGFEVKLKDGKHTCSACKRVFTTKHICQMHIRNCHASGINRSCIPPKRRLRSYKIRGCPVEVKSGSYVCLTCSASFYGRLSKHQIMSHIIESHSLQKNLGRKRTEITAAQVENRRLKIPMKHFYFGVPVDVSEIGEYSCGACSSSFGGKYAQFNCKTHIRHTHHRGPDSSVLPVIPEKAQVILSVQEAERAAQAVVGMTPPAKLPLQAEFPAVPRHADVNGQEKSGTFLIPGVITQ